MKQIFLCLYTQRSDAYISQSDVRHSMRRGVDADRDQVTADQSFGLHSHQVFEHIAFRAEVFKMINSYRKNAVFQERINFLQDRMNQFSIYHCSLTLVSDCYLRYRSVESRRIAVDITTGHRHFEAPQVVSCEVPPATTQTGWRSAVLQMQ